MPKNTKVHQIYETLLRQGKSKETAAAIAQAVSGQSLKTGKPIKQDKQAKKS